MILNLYSSSDNTLYLIKFRENISKGFKVFEQTKFPNQNF